MSEKLRTIRMSDIRNSKYEGKEGNEGIWRDGTKEGNGNS